MKWLQRGDVPSNKITPLYLPKQHMFPGVGEGLTLVKDKYASVNFFPPGKIPRYISSHLAHGNFLENEKLFRQQVKQNFGSFTLMMDCPRVLIERPAPLNRNSKVYKHIAF